MAPNPVARLSLDEIGLDAVCDAIADGKTMTAIARDVGVSFGSLSTWIAADTERSARVWSARKSAACVWDELAEERLDRASDAFELSKAKEIAFHYRWRASKIAPSEYGDTKPDSGTTINNFVLIGVTESPTSGDWQRESAKVIDG